MVEREGVRFSLNYLERGDPTSDSQRMRRRLYRLFVDGELYKIATAEIIEMETGAAVNWGSYGRDWQAFFLKANLRDLLDTITVTSVRLEPYSGQQKRWLGEVQRVFDEENVSYRLDKKGGVHFRIDGEFTHNQASALALLEAPRFRAARAHFVAAQRAMDGTPPATREAIRQTFECVETIFKLMFPDVARLGATEVKKKLRARFEQQASGTERDGALKLCDSFEDWINSAHAYRHGQGVEVPDNPGVPYTVLAISLGASYARWLAGLDWVSQY